MNCAWDLLETLEFFLMCPCLWKQAKDAGTFCPAIKKSHSWDSNSKCLEKKHMSQPQSQQQLSWSTPFSSSSLMRKYTPFIYKMDWPNSHTRKQRPLFPPMATIHVRPAGCIIFLPSSPTSHHCCCLLDRGAPQNSKQLSFHSNIN